ncbi:MAG: alanine dehydrogenase [Pseudomonadota bacterium]
MIIGVPKELKNKEYRVGLTPDSAYELISEGHRVLVEQNAGGGIGANDLAYEAVGATVVDTAEEVFAESDMIVKVKEPLAVERAMLREGQILYTYLHLAPDPVQTQDLIESGATCIAYETVTGNDGSLPLLKPMSQVAGRLAVQAGATALENGHGGRGVLLGGVPGVRPANVVIIGGGVVGMNAAQMAVGLQANVTILDRSAETLERLNQHFGSRVNVLHSTASAIEQCTAQADLVIGAVLLPGAAAPKLLSREMLGGMKSGAVLVDVAIDQGGCFETSKATSHSDPTYVVDDIVHYCVTNMPGAVARTSTYALNIATLGHAMNIANKGWTSALSEDANLRNGLNVWNGKVTCPPVASALGYDCISPDNALSSVQ